MDVEELLALTAWVDKFLVARRTHRQYNVLAAVLNENAQGVQPRKPMDQELAALFSNLEGVEVNQLTLDQLEFLGRLGLADHVAGTGIENVKRILADNPIDISTTARRINEIAARVGKGIELSNGIKAALANLVELQKPTESTAVLRVRFAGASAVKNIVDLKQWSKEWHDIGRGIALAVGQAPETITVVGARKGSIIIELGVLYGIAKIVSAIMMECLKVAGRTLEIQEQYEKIRALRLANAKLAEDLRAEIERERKAGLERIEQDIEKLIIRDKPLSQEERTALGASTKKLVAFGDSGS